ncbi:hypothetical protein H8E07_11410 [bacterium]|nr:hypothetical protein [bacterium]
MRFKSSLIFSLLILACAVQAQPVFQVGNLNPPMPPSVEFIHTGLEDYAYLIYPPDQGSCTEGGFELVAIHMYLELTANQVPVTFTVSGALAQADWDPSLNEFVPGPFICEGPDEMYHIELPGIYVITVPMQDSCGCQAFDEHYFLVMRFHTPFEANLPIDGLPQPGIVYNDKGAGWLDMIDYDKTAGGKVIIWGDTVCCTYSVGNEAGTWSGIKSLYR